jgi:hypothetical protein
MVVVPKVRNVGNVQRKKFSSDPNKTLAINVPVSVHEWAQSEADKLKISKSEFCARVLLRAKERYELRDSSTFRVAGDDDTL